MNEIWLKCIEMMKNYVSLPGSDSLVPKGAIPSEPLVLDTFRHSYECDPHLKANHVLNLPKYRYKFTIFNVLDWLITRVDE